MAFAKVVVLALTIGASMTACGGAAFEDVLPTSGGDAASDAGLYPDAPDRRDARADAPLCTQPSPACDLDDQTIPMGTPCPAGRECYERGSTCAGRVRCMRGAVVWGNDAAMLEAVDDGGGFQPSPPPLSQCNSGAGTWTYSRSTGKLGYQVCNTAVTPYVWVSGSRALSAGERASVEAAASALTLYQGNDQCGADKQRLTVSVTKTSGATTTYTDAFYACLEQPPYVQNIDGVFSTLRALDGK